MYGENVDNLSVGLVACRRRETKDGGTFRRLDSLREYLLVPQDKVCVEQFTRQPDGKWLKQEYTQVDQIVHLESVNIDLPAQHICEGIIPAPP